MEINNYRGIKDNKIKLHWFFVSLNFYSNGLIHTYGEHISANRREINERDIKEIMTFKKGSVINNIIYLGEMTEYQFFFDPNKLDDQFKKDRFFNPAKNLRIR